MTHSAHDSELLTVDGGPKAGTEGTRFGFFTDTSVCIGCKACEVACKEWNGVPSTRFEFTGNSMDNTGALGADAWRHVAFIEQKGVQGRDPVGRAQAGEAGSAPGLEWFGEDPGLPDGAHGAELAGPPTIPIFHGAEEAAADQQFRWLMSSDVCKHCTSAACLEVCPTGAIFYTEFSTVVVQDEVCNGCGYCVTACPYGVIERRESDGGAHKCTLCYDRMRARAAAGVREGLPDRLDPVRAARRAAGAGARPAGPGARGRAAEGAAVRGGRR
jgi:formate dehydrogenase iron-sulfur subunit